MNLRLKTFGLALIALIAFSALSAPGASATAKEFHADGEPVTLTGEDVAGDPTHFTIPGTGKTVCNTKTYTGTVNTKTTTKVKITPDYSNCNTDGFTTHITMNECEYEFTLHTGTTTTEGGATHTHGPVHIVCPENKSITLTVTFFGFSVCTIHIGTQTPTSPTVDYKNVGSGTTTDIQVKATVKGITVTTTDEGGCEGGVHHNGEFTGTATVKGYVDTGGTPTSPKDNGVHTGIWVA